MTLGQVLKEARLRSQMSLRDVERATQISNGYLSQMESDAVKSPSPNHLYVLAEVYGVSYSLLMELAGYIVPDPAFQRVSVPGLENLADLTHEELAQVRAFVGFIRASRDQ